MADRPDFYQLISRNKRWTWALLVVFFVLLAIVCITVSVAIGAGAIGAAVGIALAFGMTFTSYAQSKSIALRSSRAVPADPSEHLRLHNLVESISIAANIPKPEVYIVNDDSPNAFATGRNPENAAVAVTTGLLEKLDRDELEGVIAHEIAHIRNYDIRVMTVAVATAGAIAIIVDIVWRMLYFGGGGRRRSNNDNGGAQAVAMVGLVIIAVLAPLAAALLKAAISRRRESLADATAVELTRFPEGLRKALEKLDADTTVIRRTNHATSHLWIESPDDHQPGHKGRKFNDMFDTHPPLRERINILRAIEGLPEYDGPSDATVRDLERRAARVAESAPSETAAPDSNAPAGWYPDPGGTPDTVRYWDGFEWTPRIHRYR